MGLSLFLAKLLGIYMVIMGLFWLMRRDFLLEVAKDYYKSPALVLIAGVLALATGLAILIGHPVFELNWRGLITLVGVLSLLKGFLRLFALDYGNRLAEKCLEKAVYPWVGVVTIAWGVILTYFGFKQAI